MGRSVTSAVGDLLREWRGVRGMSQLDLALTAIRAWADDAFSASSTDLTS